MKQMTLEEISKAAASGAFRKIPVSREIYSDIRTPVETLKVLQGVSSHCYMLESVEDKKQWGRYTFLGYDPSLELTCVNGNLTITADAAEMKKVEDIPESHEEQLPTGQIRLTAKTAHPGAVIKTLIEKNKSPKIATLPTFTGGLVGYFSYDYIKYSEPTLKLDAEDQEHFKDVDLMLFDKVIAYDNYRQKIVLMINIETENLEENYEKAVQELEKMEELIRFGKPAETKAGHLKSEFHPLFDEKAYCEKVEQVKHYIHEGDLFQLVLSNRLEADFEGSLFDTYRVLRTTNPSPYMFYFSSDDVEIAGASPETLVKVEDGEVRTFPLAGTRPRGKSYEEDQRLEKELLADEKERAEHNMLVDLGRNDLGKICDFGTVEVEKYMSIERYSHVMHIGSTVKGQLRKDKTAVDAIDSVLPAGTLSGAPKLRACQIINELENNKRGIYGGAIGYLDFTGNLDTCIAIRIAYQKNGRVFVRSGAGIVADSVPETEYEECLNKAKAVMRALELARPLRTPQAGNDESDAAFLLLEDAAQKGNAEAMFLVGQFYDPQSKLPRGSIPADMSQAKHWYDNARSKGYAEADKALAALRRHVEGEAAKGNAEASLLLREWK